MVSCGIVHHRATGVVYGTTFLLHALLMKTTAFPGFSIGRWLKELEVQQIYPMEHSHPHHAKLVDFSD